MSTEIAITRKGYIVVDGQHHIEEKEAIEHAVNRGLRAPNVTL